MQQRYYDTGIGIFLSVDPVMAYSNPIGQFHRYRYANNNPFRFVDPDGRQSCGSTGSRLCMSEAGLKSRLTAIEKHESTRTYKSEARAARAFANRALPVQQASGREIGANMERRGGNDKIGLTDFAYGEKGSVEIPKYAGSYGYVGTIHTHPTAHPLHEVFSGSGAYAIDGKIYGAGWTHEHDVAEALRRGGISIVVDVNGDMFQFRAADWLRESDRNPGVAVYAGYSTEPLKEP